MWLGQNYNTQIHTRFKCRKKETKCIIYNSFYLSGYKSNLLMKEILFLRIKFIIFNKTKI